MNIPGALGRFAAMAAAAGLILTPLASADRGRGHDDGWREYVRHDRDDWRDDWRDDHHGRYAYHDDWRDVRHDRRKDRHRGRYYDSYRPVVVYAPPPRAYYAPRRHVSIHYGPYYSHGYRPRYEVGGYYHCAPRRTVYITDYDRYGLYAPPRGYHWVRDHDSGDAILASVATGAIIGLFVGALASY